MRNIFVALLLALFCLNLSGCCLYKLPKNSAEIAALDYGPYPEDYQEIMIRQISAGLPDPYSAHYEFDGPPTRKYQPPLLLDDEVWGWGGTVYVNAKNQYGAYAGARPRFYIIRYGRVVW